MAQALRRPGVNIFDASRPMWQLFFVFLIPLMLSNILQSASQTFSSIFLGRMLGVNALAAVSAVFPIIFLLFSFLIGIASGSNVLIGQAYGAGDEHRVKKVAGTVLGATFETLQRDGWTLLHGDRPPPAGVRSIIGHLHPSLRLGGDASVPAFLASANVIVLPALTPYSPGLDVCSEQCIAALAPWNVRRNDLQVVASTAERVYPFGTLSTLCQALRRPGSPPALKRFRRKFLRPDR